MITMFACIMAIGVVVDDAIVVGENIDSHWRRGKPPAQSAIDGASAVALPVAAAMATTIAAFIPLFIMEGVMGKFVAVIPSSMVAALLASLLECLVIMPPHLAHSLPARRPDLASQGLRAVAQRLRRAIDEAITWIIEVCYGPVLRWAVTYRLIVAAAAIAILLLAAGVVGGGHINFVFFPKTDAEVVLAQVTLPQGTSADRTLAIISQIEQAAWRLNRVFAAEREPVVKNTLTVVGRHTRRSPEIGSHAGEVMIELAPAEQRSVSSSVILAKWRELSGDAPEALALTFGLPEVGPGLYQSCQTAGRAD